MPGSHLTSHCGRAAVDASVESAKTAVISPATRAPCYSLSAARRSSMRVLAAVSTGEHRHDGR
ncbi:MAG: hypothetical protein AVDCRST_MAG48-2649 [uncultured Friedmanniella sp.]|uniref:Uncharacterized protein n=1 Tax=uncultured Friedmanniella sp. TaxID=335381 RepID=A0A6J4L3E0_9ACTN|nr:MAG: hypothetical protein AVDCRST_MAG48-2649 [uncultured Friedmanniella sp.]